MPDSVMVCINCGAKNRIGSQSTGVPRCGVCHTLLPWIVATSAAEFDQEITASVPVLIDFWAPWCGPCRAISPVVESVGHEHAGRLKVVKLDVDEAPQISERFEIRGIPLLVLVRDGAEVDRLTGSVPPAALRRWLEPHLAPAAEHA